MRTSTEKGLKLRKLFFNLACGEFQVMCVGAIQRFCYSLLVDG